MRLRLAPVRSVVIEPGAVTTEMLVRAAITGERITGGMTAEQQGRYAAHARSRRAGPGGRPRGVPAEEAGRVGADAIPASGRVPATPWVATRRSSYVSSVSLGSDPRPLLLLALLMPACSRVELGDALWMELILKLLQRVLFVFVLGVNVGLPLLVLFSGPRYAPKLLLMSSGLQLCAAVFLGWGASRPDGGWLHLKTSTIEPFLYWGVWESCSSA